MGSKYHTIIVVPHERAQFRKWRISTLQVRMAIGLVVVATLAAGAVAWLSFSRRVDDRELAQLRQENEQLRQVTANFESSVEGLQRQLVDYESRTRQLAIVAGIETLSSSTEAGIGGLDQTPAGGPEVAIGRVGELGQRLSSLSSHLDQVEQTLDERRRWISATPAILPVRGILTSGFGVRRDPITGRPALHQALDIAAAPGKAVLASADGVVVKAAHDGGLGLSVFLAHGFDVSTRYSHLSRVAVEAGQKVKRGDVIGYVGNSGRSTGYHLHYEVLVNGEPVNPLAYVLDLSADSSS
jgi:murein DD-endopeptidase MepM/ murein hydrolase activator NlpD